jgi:AMP-polyphosphate phosphotransferase
MFESAELGNVITKEEFRKLEPGLRTRLLDVQRMLAESRTAVMIVIGGVEGAGKSETVNFLLSWLDARGIEVHALDDPTDEEQERPPFWRFWRMVPPRGKVSILMGAWYADPIENRVYGRTDDTDLDLDLHLITQFERLLANEGVVLVKLWLHLSKKVQKKRLRSLSEDSVTAWRVSSQTWKYHKKYDAFREVSEGVLRKTSLEFARWHIVEGADERYRHVTAATILADAMQEGIRTNTAAYKQWNLKKKPDLPVPKRRNVIDALNLSSRLPDAQYRKRLAALEADLSRLTHKMYEAKGSMTLVFEGPDAAGKGGTIRHLTAPIDARLWQHMSVAAPTDEERAHPYLWRFWRKIPRRGHITIYDRSWYGRVLVERIEGFCTEEQWRRAYSELTQFEEQLQDFGGIVIKFWLAISSQEQLKRFKDRETTPYKQYKLTEEDWRNRKKWGAYIAAACDMVERTSTSGAPWVLVEANDKHWARIKVMKTVRDALKAKYD